MQTTEKIWMNGNFVAWDEARVHVRADLAALLPPAQDLQHHLAARADDPLAEELDELRVALLLSPQGADQAHVLDALLRAHDALEHLQQVGAGVAGVG